MGKFIGEALDSIGSQTYRNWEVIVVDDCGPEDGTAATVAEFARAHPERRVEFSRHGENSGVSRARNTAIEATQGEFLAFLDPDDWWELEYLEKQLEGFRTNPRARLVFTGTQLVDVGGEQIHEWSPPDGYLEDWPANLYRRNFIIPSATVARKSVVVDAGGFDVAPAIQHTEDWDLWIRLEANGAVFHRSAAPLVHYRQHRGSACADESKFILREDALWKKHGAHPLMTQMLVQRVRELEVRLNLTTQDLRNMVRCHHKTFDYRLKAWCKWFVNPERLSKLWGKKRANKTESQM